MFLKGFSLLEKDWCSGDVFAFISVRREGGQDAKIF